MRGVSRNEAATRVGEGKDARGVSVDGGTAKTSDDHKCRVRSFGHFCMRQVWQWRVSSGVPTNP